MKGKDNAYRIKPWVKELCKNPTLSKLDKEMLKFLNYEHQHLWRIIGLHSDDENERAQAAVDFVVYEICEKVLQPQYFGNNNDKKFAEELEYFRDCIKTHFEVCRFTERKK